MKFTIDRDHFIKALQRIQGIVEKRNTMPILANVLIEASSGNGGRITTVATDLEVFIKDATEANVTEEGSVTVSARKLFEIVKGMKDSNIDVSSSDDDKVTIKAGKARFNIMGLPASEFPVFPEIDEASLHSLENETLKEMIDKTSFAVSTDETRYNINGFLFEKTDGTIKMVTTDGHRLALIEKGATEGLDTGGKASVLMPRKGVVEFRKLLDEHEGDFFLGVTDKNAVMKKDDTVINTRLLEGEFPDYNKVIPKENNNEVKVDRTVLLESLKLVSILSTDRIKGVKFSFSPSTLVLTASSPEIGEATEELDIDYDGDAVEVAFNARYFIDMLEASDEERVMIKLKDAMSPALMKPIDRDDYTYIIMPMRL